MKIELLSNNVYVFNIANILLIRFFFYFFNLDVRYNYVENLKHLRKH